MNKTIKSWLPFAVGGTVLSIMIYAAVQQAYRQIANDPQIGLAEQGAAALASGQPVFNLFLGGTKIDMTKEISTFGMVFDDTGSLIMSSAAIGTSSNPFVPPAGVFDAARAKGREIVTWKTETGLRFAAVVMPWRSITPEASGAGQFPAGFVLTARSLRDTDARIGQLGYAIAAGWAGYLAATFLTFMAIGLYERKKGRA